MPKTQTEYQRPMQHHQIYQHVHNGVTEGGEREEAKICQQIMAKNMPNLMKNSQKTQQTPMGRFKKFQA